MPDSETTPQSTFVRHAFRVLAWCGLVLWAVVFALLFAYAPMKVRLIAIAWAALGAAAPRLFLLSLALALPLFGNNPGGPHALYLLDMALMGFVGRDLVLKGIGRREVQPGPFNGLVRLFFVVSTFTLFPQHMHIYCEAVVYRSQFFFNIYNHYANASMYGMRVWLDLALAVSFFAALRDSLLPGVWRTRLWLALLAGAAIASFAGLLDYFGVVSLVPWRGENPNITRFGYSRLQSLFWHSGWFAQYLTALAPAALAFAAAPRREGMLGNRWFWGGVAALFGVTTLLTFQRGGWFAFLAGFGIVAIAVAMNLTGPGRRKLIGALAIAAVAAGVMTALLAIAIPPLGERLTSIARIEDRSKIWHSGYLLGRMRPLSGVGLGNYATAHHYMYSSAHPYSQLDKMTPHNSYIYIFAERGVVALGIFAAVLLGAMFLLWRRFARVEGEPEDRVHALALLGGITSMAAYSIFQDLSYVRAIDLIFWMQLGMASLILSPVWIFSASGLRGMAPKAAWAGAAIALIALMTIEQRKNVRPFLVAGPDGLDYVPGKQEVRIPIPENARRIAVPVYCDNPGDLNVVPVTYTFALEEKVLSEIVFTEQGVTSATLDVSGRTDAASPLVVRTSHPWSPYRYGLRQIPILESGVKYREPIVLEGSGGESK